MKQGTRALYRGGLSALLLGGAVWLTGCGSGGSSPSGSSGLRVAGYVEAPATQVAIAPLSPLSRVAQALSLGSPAEAAGPMSRRRLHGATVTVIRVTDAAQIGTTVTDNSGQFSIDLTGAQVGDVVMLVVKGDGSGGKLILRRIIHVGSGTQTVSINEATTVGAAAAEEGLADGATADEAVTTADQTATAEEVDEQQNPADVPDVHESQQAHIREHAHGHLQGNFDSKLQLALTGTPSLQTMVQAVMAAQAYARVNFGLSPEIHLSRAQVQALANLVAANTTFTKAQVATMLGTTEDKVAAALDSLKATPRLTSILSGLDADKVPAVLVVVLAEKSGTGFQITTQDQLNALINALADATVPGPAPLPELGGDTPPAPNMSAMTGGATA